MRRRIVVFAAGALIFSAGCSIPTSQSPPAKPQAAKAPAQPAVPDDVQGAAEVVLGAETEVLVHGDLARTGSQQAVAINRVKKTPTGAVPGILFTRAAIVEKDGGKWKEVLRVDEHLKNPKGYLGATPLAPVTGWRLQYEQSAEKGIQLYFTPLQAPAGGYALTIGVRWNKNVKRYQSLDRKYEQFLAEVPTLEKVGFDLRR